MRKSFSVNDCLLKMMLANTPNMKLTIPSIIRAFSSSFDTCTIPDIVRIFAKIPSPIRKLPNNPNPRIGL